MVLSSDVRTWTGETNGRDRIFTLSRHHHSPGIGFAEHSHCYLECFWIEAGSYAHVFNGTTQTLVAGDLLFIGLNDRHSAVAIGDSGGTLLNLAFPAERMIGLANDLAQSWPWREPATSPFPLSAKQSQRLRQWTEDLQPPSNTLPLLIGLVADLARIYNNHQAGDPHMPPWLGLAISTFRDLDPLPPGNLAFITLCGRSSAHVSRHLRQMTGLTTTNYLNGLRLERAATWLRYTTSSVQTIAERSGMNNLPHFYRCFSARFGMTPAHFRMSSDDVSLPTSRIYPSSRLDFLG